MGSYPYRPTGRLDPAPADLAYGSLALAARASQARRGELMVLSEDAPILWRFALPRAGWGRRPLSQRQRKRAASLKRQVWLQYRAWSRSTSGVLRRVIGAVQDGTAQGFANMVPHVAAQELRQDMQQVMATCGTTATVVVMVGDRSGIHRAHQLDAPLDHDQGKFRFHGFPAHGGHHRKPSEGFWRMRQDVSGAGRCLPELQQRYQCTRHVRMAHQERPMYAFHW